MAPLLPPTTMFVHSALIGVYEQSPTSVWAAGSGDRQDEGGPVVVLHYDGHAWSKAARSFAAGFTHARFGPAFGVRAVLLQVN